MKPDVEKPLTYLPTRMKKLCSWIAYDTPKPAHAHLIDMAHLAPSQWHRREAQLVLARLDWAEMMFKEDEYSLLTYKTPLADFRDDDPEWVEAQLCNGAKPSQVVYQLCIAFHDEFDWQVYCAGVSELD